MTIKKEIHTGMVFLVGAGCGDEGLITRKGLRLLRECDVVLYDELSAPGLLEETKEGCEKIPVGKRFGKRSAAQEEIHALLVQKAREGRRVVRLKGGDPFVFGRGGEEILALQAAGIPYAVVPGVTAAVAAPAAAGIPVTHRNLARSFHVITGHTAETGSDGLPEDFDVLARLKGTLVFLMGLHHLEKIAGRLMENGKRPDTPAAVISRGATAAQKNVRAPLGEIAAAARAAGLEAPAVIVVGEAAGLALSPPMGNLRVGVTGTHSHVRKLRDGLEEWGVAVTEMEISRLTPYEENPALDAALREAGSRSRWAVLTSPNGADALFSHLKKQRMDIRALADWKFAVIGPGTAQALEKRGIFAAYMPKEYNVESLAEGLCETVRPGEEILILRAEKGSPALTERLEAAGLSFREIKLYDIAADRERLAEAREKAAEMDVITFASGSSVRNFLEGGWTLPEGVRTVCIGAATAQVLREYGYRETVIAAEASAKGIVEAILRSGGFR